MVANILLVDPYPHLTVKIQLFQNMIMLHNKLKGMEHRAPYSLLTHTLNLWVGLKGKRSSECGHVAYQIKGKEV